MVVDCHIHCALSGFGKLKKGLMSEDTPEREGWFSSLATRYRKHNVKALRDGGDAYGAGTAFKPIAEDAGIIFRTPLVALYKTGHYGDFLGEAITDFDSCRKKMDQLLKRRPDFIKIIQSGIMSFDHFGEAGSLEFTDAELCYLIDRAHDAGLRTMVHVNTPKGIMMAIEAGADSIEHGYCIDADCIAAMKEKDIVWVPTLAPFANIASCDESHPLSRYREVSQRYFTGHKLQVRKAHEAGVTIALGSDAGASLVIHGQASREELSYLMDCGLTKAEVFTNGCRVLELDEAQFKK